MAPGGVQCFDQLTGEDGSHVLAQLASGVNFHVEYHGFVHFISCCPLNSDLGNSVYRCSAELDWLPVDGVPHYFPHGFSFGRVQDLVAVFVQSRKRDRSGVPGADILHAAGDLVWLRHSAHLCSLARTVDLMHPPSRTDTRVAHPPPALPRVLYVYDVDLDQGASGI